jgi:PLP dependent protein
MKSIADNIKFVRQRIENAKKKAGRKEQTVSLLAISKTKPAEAIRQAWQAGLHHFGENYVQEARIKMAELSDLDLCWHFTGPIQANKTKYIADGFSWVHTVDRLKVAQRLSAQRPPGQPPLNICLQVNINHEAGKAGIDEQELSTLAIKVNQLPNLTLRGLMCLPNPEQTAEELHHTFARMRNLLCQLALQVQDMDTLSMGMSRDLEIAIIEGATIVRVGTDIFGPREPRSG